MSRKLLGKGLVLVVGAVLVVGVVVEVRHRLAKSTARRALSARRLTEARQQLKALAANRPWDGETHLLLGDCAVELGRDDEARTAWDAISPRSAHFGEAGVRLARLALRRHRLADGERLLLRATGETGAHAIEAIDTLVHLYKIEGRFAEARRLVLSALDRHPDRLGLAREIVVLGSPNPFPVEKARTALDTAYRAAPDDDRVWLGWANLATRFGQFDEAAQWLDRCGRERPGDEAIVRARLQLAVALGDPVAARTAIRQLPGKALAPNEVLKLVAWFAHQMGDPVAERRVLEALLVIEPANSEALERLAEIEVQSDRPKEAADLRKRRAVFDRARAKYELLLFEADAPKRIAELVELARELKRPDEVRALAPVNTAALVGLVGPPPSPMSLREMVQSFDVIARRVPTASSDQVGATPRYEDEATVLGLRFTFQNGATDLRQLPETMSGGVALLDYDGDGWMDIYCVQGGMFPPQAGPIAQGDRLFRNQGDGTFEDVTIASGIAQLPGGYGHGVTVGDYDNDGRPDLFITRWRSYALFHNRGDGTFEDATEALGLSGDRDWPTSAAFADLDGDGALDLYVCHYLAWDDERPSPCWDETRKRYVYCGPLRFAARPDHLFRNDNGRFMDVSAEAGIVDRDGRGMGVVACDFDGDGHVDLFVANDQSANFLWRNLGGLRFEDLATTAGVAGAADGQFRAGMGIALGDPDHDGLPDLAVTNFYNQGTTFYRNLGSAFFSDHSADTGLLARTRFLLGFGVAFLDANNDGFLDLVSTNGHIDDLRPQAPFQMPAQLLLGSPGVRWGDVSDRVGAAFAVPRLGRGLAVGDVDNDGRLDIILLGQQGPVACLRNGTEGGRWLILCLEGTDSNRDAIGARVSVKARGRTWTCWRFGGGSYQSAHDPRLHFGLGDVSNLDEVAVLWPSGRLERFPGVTVDTGHLLREGEGKALPLAGFER